MTAFLLTWRLLRLVAIEEMLKRVQEEILSLQWEHVITFCVKNHRASMKWVAITDVVVVSEIEIIVTLS